MDNDFDFAELEKLKETIDYTEGAPEEVLPEDAESTLDEAVRNAAEEEPAQARKQSEVKREAARYERSFFEENDDDMEFEQNEQRKFELRVKLAVAAVLVGIVLLGALTVFRYLRSHVYVAGRFYALSSASVDLRGKAISLDEYEELCTKYPEYKILWDVPIQGVRYTTSSAKVTVSRLTEKDLAAMAYLPKLRQVKADDCHDYELLQRITELYPRVRVSYRVQIGNKEWPPAVVSMDVSRKDVEDLKANLQYLQNIVQVNFTDTFPEEEDIQELEQLYPGIVFYGLNDKGVAVQRSGNPSSIVLDNRVYSLTDTVLNLKGASLADEKLNERLGLFENLKMVCVEGSDLTPEQINELKEAYPEVKFLTKLAFGKVELNESAKTIDISGQKMADVSEIEEMLPFFPELTKVIMSNCGIGNDDMDALNKRHSGIEFVWSVKIGNLSVRTDERVFSVGANTGLRNQDLENLRYCTNMICVDIYRVSNATSIDWAANMPNLTYLVISETKVADLTPLTGLRKLVYLEMFRTKVTDYSPLVSCTALSDLNVGWTYGEPEPIAEMKWLKNVYWGDCTNRTKSSGRAPSVLALALPEANLIFSQSNPVGEGWRRLNNYYTMRDLMGLQYQDQTLKVSDEILEKIAALNGETIETTAKK